MPEEAPAPAADSAGQDTPQPSGTDTPQAPSPDELSPEHLASQKDVDWQERYQHLHPTYTKTSQKAAELERALSGQKETLESLGLSEEWLKDASDPDTQEAAFRWLQEQLSGVLPEDEPEEEGEYEDEEEAFSDPRVEGLTQEVQSMRNEQILSDMETHVDDLSEDQGVELTEKQHEAIMREAIDSGANPKATEAAFQGWMQDNEAFEKQAIEKYVESKKASRPGTGQSASHAPDLKNERERQEYMAHRLQDSQQ